MTRSFPLACGLLLLQWIELMTGQTQVGHEMRAWNVTRDDAALDRADGRPGGRAVGGGHRHHEGFERAVLGAVDEDGPVQSADAAGTVPGSLADFSERQSRLQSVELIDRREKRVADD